MVEPTTEVDRIRQRIYEHVGDDYPLLGLLVDLERAIEAATRATPDKTVLVDPGMGYGVSVIREVGPR